jgi:cell fate regulator YaaT (PSP1 superfamily)
MNPSKENHQSQMPQADQEEGNPQSTESSKPEGIYRVRILHSSAMEYCRCKDSALNLQSGDHVVVPTRYGKDLGVVVGSMCSSRCADAKEIRIIDKKVGAQELEIYEQNKEKEAKAYQICLEKINEHDLKMKLVSAHYLFGESKILFFFTAESRVDFRDLVKDLVARFHTRIELRQIGVRDESRVLGGMGVCGRDFCCHSVSDRMNPVSIKMAKKQNLSLNSLKISGPCGRLLCCLAYEYDFYKETKDKLPSEGSRISFEGERCKVAEVNVLSRKIRLSCAEGRVADLPFERFQYLKDQQKWEVLPEPSVKDAVT